MLIKLIGFIQAKILNQIQPSLLKYLMIIIFLFLKIQLAVIKESFHMMNKITTGLQLLIQIYNRIVFSMNLITSLIRFN